MGKAGDRNRRQEREFIKETNKKTNLKIKSKQISRNVNDREGCVTSLLDNSVSTSEYVE